MFLTYWPAGETSVSPAGQKSMSWFPFKTSPKSFLGIDIGTSSIKVIELSRKGQALKLENYGEIKTASLQKSPFITVERDTLLLSNREVAGAIKTILKTAEIKTRRVNFSLPDFSSFFTTFELPPMSQKEVPQAIKYEARSYIPLPLSEITLDWSIIEGEAPEKKQSSLKILVVAVPNEVINQYQQIAALSKLEMRALEAEAFALARFLVRDEKRTLAIIDMGARSTTVNILENGILKISHSFNMSGNELTEILNNSLKIDYEKAEEIKKNIGLAGEGDVERNIKSILLPLIDSVLSEVKRVFQEFFEQTNKKIEKIILAGGSALMPGFKEYCFNEFQKEIEIAAPFKNVSYPPLLEEIIKEMGPTYVIALGLALKGFE